MVACMLNGPRILLRQWKDSDYPSFVEQNTDPETMRYFPATPTEEQSIQLADRIRKHINDHHWGLWAVEIEGEFAGFTGFMTQSFEAHFTPAIEIGWRFSKEFWGQGFATEAARVATLYAFTEFNWSDIVSMTAHANLPSQRVMQRLGMTYDPTDDFLHPKVPEGNPLQHHCLYRLKNTPAVIDGIRETLRKE